EGLGLVPALRHVPQHPRRGDVFRSSSSPAGRCSARPQLARPLVDFEPGSWARWLSDLQKPRNPSPYARSIGGVFGAEYLLEPNLILQQTLMEPVGAAGEDD